MFKGFFSFSMALCDYVNFLFVCSGSNESSEPCDEKQQCKIILH